MLVETDFMYTSGEGNQIFSKSGALNRYQHLVFHDRHFESQRQRDLYLKSIPEELQGDNDYLPKILNKNSDDNGSSEEHAKRELDRLMNEITQELSASKVATKRSRTIMNESELDSDQNYGGTINRTQVKPKGKKGNNWSFKTVSRNESSSQKMFYYGPQKNPAPGHYRPELKNVKLKE